MTMGQRLLALRTRAGLSQEALAERLGVSRQSISKWETDGSIPDLDNLVRLSGIFGVTLDDLVKGSAEDQRMLRENQATASLLHRLQALYRNKAYLLGWLLAGSGAGDLLRSAGILLSFQAAAGEDAASQWFLVSLPYYLCAVLKILAGLLAVLWGRRVSGRFRWYHLGWVLTVMGLFGVPRWISFLQFGPLESLLTDLLSNLRPYPGYFSSWFTDTDNLFLMAAGLLCIILGARKAACTDHIS